MYKIYMHFIGLSPSLISILNRMMDPNPDARPTVNQLLQESTVRWACFKHRLHWAYGQVVWSCRTIFSGLVYLVMVIFGLFTLGE